MELRDRLKELRSESRLSQARLASILGIPQTTYSNYETGRGRPPLAILKKIAAFYGVTADELLGKNGTEEQAIAAQISALPQEERQALKLVLNALTAWTNGRGGGDNLALLPPACGRFVEWRKGTTAKGQFIRQKASGLLKSR